MISIPITFIPGSNFVPGDIIRNIRPLVESDISQEKRKRIVEKFKDLEHIFTELMDLDAEEVNRVFNELYRIANEK